jgi:hypothetical protein
MPGSHAGEVATITSVAALDAGTLVSVFLPMPARSLQAGKPNLTPSSLRALVREARDRHPQLAGRRLADVGIARTGDRAEVRLFFGCAEGECAPADK